MTAYKIGTTNSEFLSGVPFPFAKGSTGADSLTIDPSGYLISDTNDVIQLDGLGAWTVNIQGLAMSRGSGSGIFRTSGDSSALNITIGVEGAVSAGAFGIISQSIGAATITNAGVITSDNTAIQLAGKATITNSGTITTTSSTAVETFGQTSIKNTGFITGDIVLNSNDAHAITSSKSIFGDITFGKGSDTLTNNLGGSIGAIGQVIDFDDGTNKLINSGDIGSSVTFGIGNDTVTNSGTIFQALTLDSGNNAVTNTGTLKDDVTFGEGNDSFTNSGTKSEVQGFLLMGNGTNVIKNAGLLSDIINGGSGNDTLTNSGVILNGASLLGGKNVVTNTGTISGTIGFDGSDNSFTNSGAKSVMSGDLLLSQGTNKVINAGQMNGLVYGNNDIDQISNTGTMATVELFDSADVVTNSGSIGNLDTGSGNDKVTNNGTIGILSLGDGDDTYTGGAKDEIVGDSNGLDTIKLGTGNDVYNADGAASGLDGKDKIDAGSGTDRYNAAAINVGLRINIDGADHNEKLFGNIAIVKNSATAAVATPAFTDDAIVGFEQVVGSLQDDVIYGNALANNVLSSSGNDKIAGYAGDDTLSGGTGDDVLWGGAGADSLTGGGNDDTFLYAAVTDSGLGIPKRDVITDFNDGQDKILITFDSNTKDAGYQPFFYLNEDLGTPVGANFTGVAGELRSIWTLNGFLFEGDLNGDTKVDFQIEVIDADHSTIWTTSQVGNTLLLQ